MGTEIFNKTINRIVEVPDGAVDVYLAQDAYRKVTKADRGPQGGPDMVTVTKAEYEARVQQAVAEALASAEADKEQAVADALAKAAADAASTPPVETP